MQKYVVTLVLLLSLSACSGLDGFWGQPEMTSPCVGAEDSPCGPKRPVNKHITHGHDDVMMVG